VHISHYGRICPIETPEGTNIGLISSVSGIYARTTSTASSRRPTASSRRARSPKKSSISAPTRRWTRSSRPRTALEPDGRIKDGPVLARVGRRASSVPSSEVQYIDVSPKQIVGVSASLIPFLEHDDANRALMGSNMQRQAVPLLKRATRPASPRAWRRRSRGTRAWSSRPRTPARHVADAAGIIGDNSDEYALRKFVGLNERTCLNQKPIVRKGEKVKAGQIIADGASTLKGELALGRNVLVAFNTFDGLQLRGRDRHQRAYRQGRRLHVDPHRRVRRGDPRDEAGPRGVHGDIPNVSEKALRNLDETGIVRVGTRVRQGDILVGKVAPKSKSELTPGGEAAARDLRPRGRGREERLARGPVGRRGHRHRRAEVLSQASPHRGRRSSSKSRIDEARRTTTARRPADPGAARAAPGQRTASPDANMVDPIDVPRRRWDASDIREVT
jgi:DNA-directed RNA polymerase subunit beta